MTTCRVLALARFKELSRTTMHFIESYLSNNSMTSWFVALCSVVFDLKLGQRLEHVVPFGALTEKERADVAFHTFPDSLSQELRLCASVRDSCFFFRTKRNRVLYGFVFCRQRQDERLARGVDRRAVVVVSQFPFSSVLKPLSTFLGSIYFSEGMDGLERIHEELLSWPMPQHFKLVHLSVAGHAIHANLPPFGVFPPPAPIGAPPIRRTMSVFRNGVARSSEEGIEPTSAVFYEMDVYDPFVNVLSRLWSLWELTITAQPLMILAPSPVECSSAVAALISLIAPIPYAADFRPYFTIHDPEFLKMQAGHREDGMPTLIGVTNLYFIKALPTWPNVLSIGVRQPIQGEATNKLKRFLPTTFKPKTSGTQVLLSQHVEQLWTQEKLLVKSDADLIKEINLKSRDPQRHTELLRRHFLSLTTAFLEPFRGYFVPVEGSELRSVDGDIMPSPEASGLPEFDPNEFLASIVDWPFPSAFLQRFHSLSDLQTFYKQFLSSPNFAVWFERQQETVSSDLGLHAPLQPTPRDAHPWDCTDEVKLVEEFRRLQSMLMNDANVSDVTVRNGGLTSYEKELMLVLSAMPEDLRHVLLSSPSQTDFVKRLRRIPDIQDYLRDLPEFVM